MQACLDCVGRLTDSNFALFPRLIYIIILYYYHYN